MATYSAYNQFLTGANVPKADPNDPTSPYYLPQPGTPQQPTGPDTSNAAANGLDSRALSGLDQTLGGLQQQQGANTQYTSGLRDALMQQLGTLSQPVNAQDPALSPILNAQQLSAQRTAERQRSALAERLGTQGLSSSGALDTGILGIEQQRGETEQRGIANVLGGELQNRRTALNGLLSQALTLGDQQAAQNVQQQLQILNSQLNQSNTYDDMGYRLAALEALLNGQAIDQIVSPI